MSNSSNFQNKGTYKYDEYQQNSTSFKGGKGYSIDDKPKKGQLPGVPVGKPKGVQKGKCNQYILDKPIQTRYGILPTRCTGTIISAKITTNNKGFDTAVEEVCNECGAVHPTAFQVIGRKPKHYKTIKFTSHKDWLKQMKEDAQNENEEISYDLFENNHRTDYTRFPQRTELGSAPNTVSERKALAKALGLNTWRSEFYNRGTAERMKHKKQQYYNYVDICKSNLGLTKTQSDQVKYLINTVGMDIYDSKGQAPYEEVILCMCIYVKNEKTKQQKTAREIQEFERQKLLKKGLYASVRQKINSKASC